MNGDEILASLKTYVSKEEYDRFLAKISFDSDNSTENHLVFIVDNIFIANWAKRNYSNKIMQITRKTSLQIDFRLKSERITESKTIKHKKYITVNNQSFRNAEYRFDNFIIGECNKFAYKTAKEVANKQATRWNPLLIYGNTGLGKTHLLNAICHFVYGKKPNANITFLSAEVMFNEYRHRLKSNTMDDFRERFRNSDYLLIDDVQFLANTEKFQEEFFNTYNAVVEAGGQIVMTSDKTPKEIDKLEKRLKSRFVGGMMAKIESPELDTKISIIEQKCAENNIKIDSEIINLLATQIHDNIREIEGIILNLHGHMALLNLPITLEMVQQTLKDREIEQASATFDDIVNKVAKVYNLKPSDVRTKVRGKKLIATARKIVAFIARELINASFPHIAAELNLKDHSAVSKQIKSIKELMAKDSELKTKIRNTISQLQSNQ